MGHAGASRKPPDNTPYSGEHRNIWNEWSVIMIVRSGLVMSIVKRELSDFRIAVKQPITTVS